jgi:hypothetical protein
MKRRIVALAAIAFALAPLISAPMILIPLTPAQAEEPNADALAAATELFGLLSKDMIGQVVENVTAQTWPAMEASLRANNPNADPEAFGAMRKEFEAIQKEYMADVLHDAPAIYARNFTAAELHDMMAFYKTPTGAKMLRVTPQITTEILSVITPRLKEIMARTRAAFAAAVKVKGYRI